MKINTFMKLSVLVSSALGVSACVQPINEVALQLRPGMSEQDTINILGRMPIIREFQGRGSALQWCNTGYDEPNRYLIAFFYDEKLVGTRNYTTRETKHSCSTSYREVEWTPSDTVIEYRLK